MVAHLHPRSRSTMSLFTTCLTVSFLVVAVPHVLPCPVDRRQFSESGDLSSASEPRKRRRRKGTSAVVDAEAETDGELAHALSMDEARGIGAAKRECPVPKPGGLLGQVMGFTREEGRAGPTTVVVQSLRERRARTAADE